MTQELTKSEGKSLQDPGAVEESRRLGNQAGNMKIPFIPIITINNKKEDKEVIIDGEKKMKSMLPNPSFVTGKKDDNDEWVNEYIKEGFEAVILRDRYSIKSKHKQNYSGPEYFSQEFDTWTQPVKVFDKQSKQIIVEAHYKELKETFKTDELDSRGNNKKTFDLYSVLYVDYKDTIYRLKIKMSGFNKWFDYKNTFEDAIAGYKTKFGLTEEKVGDIDFYAIKYEKGESVDLSKEIKLQKELHKYFAISEAVKSQAKGEQPAPEYSAEQATEALKTIEVEEVDNDAGEMDISQIPF